MIKGNVAKMLEPGLRALFGKVYGGDKKDDAALELLKKPVDVNSDAELSLWNTPMETLALAWVCRFGERPVTPEEIVAAGAAYAFMFKRFKDARLVVPIEGCGYDSGDLRFSYKLKTGAWE